MSDLAWLNGAQLFGPQRNDGQRFAIERDEFDFETFVAVNEHNGSEIARA